MPTLPVPIFAALVLVFAFLSLWRRDGRLTPLTALIALCAGQTLIIALAQHYGVAAIRPLQPITATLIPPAAWVAFQATAVRSLRASDAAHLLGPITALSFLALAPEGLDIFLPALFLGYGIAIVVQSLKGPDAQPRAFLANGNLPARLWLIVGAALILSAFSDVLIIAAHISGAPEWRPWIITVFSIGNLLLIGTIGLSSHIDTDDTGDVPEPNASAPKTSEPPDQEVWDQVQDYMATRRPYLDPDLTLAKLSRKLGVPAKTLSTTINRATGENVSRYINDARIAAAQTALLEGETVTSAMLGAGFNTKSNFNREFLRVTGEAPSLWVKTHGT